MGCDLRVKDVLIGCWQEWHFLTTTYITVGLYNLHLSATSLLFLLNLIHGKAEKNKSKYFLLLFFFHI